MWEFIDCSKLLQFLGQPNKRGTQSQRSQCRETEGTWSLSPNYFSLSLGHNKYYSPKRKRYLVGNAAGLLEEKEGEKRKVRHFYNDKEQKTF